MVSVLATFKDFVFVEEAGGTVHSLFGAVVPADVDPGDATTPKTISTRQKRSVKGKEGGITPGSSTF